MIKEKSYFCLSPLGESLGAGLHLLTLSKFPGETGRWVKGSDPFPLSETLCVLWSTSY